MTKGDSIRTLSTAELLTDVRVLDARRNSNSTGTTSMQPATPATPFQPNAACTLFTHFENDNGEIIVASVVMVALVEPEASICFPGPPSTSTGLLINPSSPVPILTRIQGCQSYY